MKNKWIYGIIVAFLVLIACKKTQESTPSKSEQAQIDLTIKIYNEQIVPINDTLMAELEELKEVFQSYLADSTNTPKERVQNQWKITAKTVARAELFNITPIRRALYFDKLYAYPLAETMQESLDSVYKNATTADLSTLANNKKGMALLEYLLFRQTDLPAFEALFLASTEYLIQTQTQLIAFWKTDIGPLFTSGVVMSINTGYGELINAFIAMLEVSKKEEFDQPFAYYSDQKYAPKAPNSHYSKELFIAEYQYLDYLMSTYFYCLFENEGEENLAKNLENEFDELNLAFEEIFGQTFEKLQETAPNAQLDEIRTSVTDLIKLFKIDVVSNYSLLLSISAADGD